MNEQTETEETPEKDRKRFPTQTVTAIVAALALLLGIVALVEEGTRTVEHRMTAEDRHIAAACGAVLVATQALTDDSASGASGLVQVQGALGLLKKQAPTRKMARAALFAIEQAGQLTAEQWAGIEKITEPRGLWQRVTNKEETLTVEIALALALKVVGNGYLTRVELLADALYVVLSGPDYPAEFREAVLYPFVIEYRA